MFRIEPIAFVHSSRTELKDDNWESVRASIELAPGVDLEALDGIETFSHAEILFHFDQADESRIVWGARHPRDNLDWPRVGIFAQRGKDRPNRIGSTIVTILGREGPVLRVVGLDAVNGTPVIDIKPVMQEFLPRGPVRQPAWSHELMRDYWQARE